MGGLKIVSGLSLKKECYLNERKSEIKRNIIMVEITQNKRPRCECQGNETPCRKQRGIKKI
jgi:hypothetical protein